MVETTPELAIIIRRFRAELEKMGIRCERIMLFGSQVTGAAEEGSDIDLFVVSPDWERYGDRERFEILGIAAARIMKPIEAEGITAEEIEAASDTSFIKNVVKLGIGM